MHISDAILSPQVTVATGVLAAGGLGYSLRRLQSLLRERATVLMGSMAAFVFAAQMVNFPLFPLPISGHLLGGVLSAIMVGPWAGAVVMAAVLVVQCFVFGDGGLTALGANFLNMGLIGSVGGYAIYRPIRRAFHGPGGVVIGGMMAAWFSVILASGGFALELAASGRRGDFFAVLGWMSLVHAAIGLGEALITGMVLRFFLLVRPDLIDDAKPGENTRAGRWGQVLLGGLAISLAVATFLAPFASEHDDGLEWVGGKLGFLKEAPGIVPAPIPDYQLSIPGLPSPRLATAIAGVVGTLVVFVVAFGLARRSEVLCQSNYMI